MVWGGKDAPPFPLRGRGTVPHLGQVAHSADEISCQQFGAGPEAEGGGEGVRGRAVQPCGEM